MLRRTFLSHFLVLIGSSILRASPSNTILAADPDRDLAGELAAAANEFLRELGPESRKEIELPFDDAERRKWSNVPNAVLPRRGLALGKMSESEKAAAHRLLQAMTSTQGYLKATGIMGLESVLHEIQAPEIRDYFSPGFYFLSVFGRPAADDRWAVRLDGHHLALHLTFVDGRLSSTPFFLGTEPATVQHGHLAGLRVLGAETMKGFALRNALTTDQTNKAVLAQELPPDIFTGPDHEGALNTFAGISASRLQGLQRQLLESLIDEYLDNMHPALARSYRRKVQEDSFDSLYFAWMGPSLLGKAVYYRVHGPSILIEYDNSLAVGTTTKTNDPNHIHSIVRSPGKDFGENLLRRHHQESHHRKGAYRDHSAIFQAEREALKPRPSASFPYF
jgi:hypothetical protein